MDIVRYIAAVVKSGYWIYETVSYRDIQDRENMAEGINNHARVYNM